MVAGRSGAAKSFPAERTYLSAYLPPARLNACFEIGGLYEFVTSQYVLDEAADGDPDLSAERLECLTEFRC